MLTVLGSHLPGLDLLARYKIVLIAPSILHNRLIYPHQHLTKRFLWKIQFLFFSPTMPVLDALCLIIKAIPAWMFHLIVLLHFFCSTAFVRFRPSFQLLREPLEKRRGHGFQNGAHPTDRFNPNSGDELFPFAGIT